MLHGFSSILLHSTENRDVDRNLVPGYVWGVVLNSRVGSIPIIPTINLNGSQLTRKWENHT